MCIIWLNIYFYTEDIRNVLAQALNPTITQLEYFKLCYVLHMKDYQYPF